MTTDTRPQWLIDACVEYMARPKFQPPTDGYTPGDLWVVAHPDVVSPVGGSRSVVVVTQYCDFHVEIALCHTFQEFASDVDLIYDARQVAPYPIVACGELYGTVMWEQLLDRVGRIPADHALALTDAWRVDANDEPGASIRHLPHGLPWMPWDRGTERWQFVQDFYWTLRDIRTPSLRCLLWDWV